MKRLKVTELHHGSTLTPGKLGFVFADEVPEHTRKEAELVEQGANIERIVEEAAADALAKAIRVAGADAVLPTLPAAFAQRVAQWAEHPRVRALRDDARQRLVRLVQRTGAWLEEGRVTEVAAVRMADWIEPLLRRESYLALLQERPSVHERLLRLLGAARWPARYLQAHPGVIDELAGRQLMDERFDAAQFDAELEARRAALRSTGRTSSSTSRPLTSARL